MLDIGAGSVTVHTATASDSTYAYGDFLPGFELNLFRDSGFSKPLSTQADILIGQSLYASADWKISTLTNSISFFIDRCDVIQEAKEIRIINGNCYSKLLGAKSMNGNHMQAHMQKNQMDWP